jgi:menaquinone-9 beta-reductase
VQEIQTDIIIIGAGPAGVTMALMLAGSGLQVTVLEKEHFPRDKICGDALSGKVISILKRLPGDVYGDFLASVPKTPSHGIRFVSPGFYEADIPFHSEGNQEPSGYICRRKEFDAFMASKLAGHANILLLEDRKAESVERTLNGFTVTTADTVLKGKLIAGADGVHSMVRSQLSKTKPERSSMCTGIRAYYEGVTGFPEGGFIELFFLRELLPFYFWIFPEVDGQCNAGLAMLQPDISEFKANLGVLLDRIVHSHPRIAPRFAAARMTRRAEAHALPLAMPAGPFSGDGFLLLGDAASMVDPFTGEGIGNAMACGEVAARVAKLCFEKGDLSQASLKEFDRQMLRRMGAEIRRSVMLHRMARYPWLFDRAVRLARKNKAFRDLLMRTMAT